MLPSRGIVVIEHERNPLSHGDVTWIERKKVFEIANKCSSKIIFLFLALVIYKYIISCSKMAIKNSE
jgi:hypothetical protein